MILNPERRPLVVAEISANHNRSLERALRIVEAAAWAGADAIKLQTYTAATMTLDLDVPPFRIDEPASPWRGMSLYELYSRAATPWEWHRPLFDKARRLGLLAFSTPFDASAVEFLEELGVPAYKIASFEVTDLPLIAKAASTGKPLIISTGMATVAEIDEAVRTAREAGSPEVVLLKCTSTYPAPPGETNLRAIPHMREVFSCPVGLSDHTPGIGAAVASVALGAVLIEKHLTLSREEGGLDAAFSLEPAEMQRLVQEVRTAWEALGGTGIGPAPSEEPSRVLRRSLFVVRDMDPGEVLTESHLRALRPGAGLPPKYRSVLIGRRVRRRVPRGTAMTWDLLL